MADDTPCDDGDACTTGDSCQAGVCALRGGGIFINDLAARVTLTGTTVTQNSASVGGGIDNRGTLNVDADSSVRDNTGGDCQDYNSGGGTGCP